jgi:formyltetrahydrofolate deformylase
MMPIDNSAARARRGRLLVSCPDQPGIVAAVSRFLFERGANIVQSQQHTTDPSGGRFFLRVEFDLEGLSDNIAPLGSEFVREVAGRYGIVFRFASAAYRQRLGVFVSKEDHALQELLWQQRSGDLPADIAIVIGNHPQLENVVAPFGIPFRHVPVAKDDKPAAEATQLKLLRDAQVDTVVLARYMQIVTSEFITPWANRLINIHHSFLPAFIGANPYAQAHERGVKLIGATAHYVTTELDAGPIIEQDVHRVDHRHTVEEMRRIGRQVERVVLARAVSWHVQDRVLVDGNKTVVFT